MRSKRIIRKQRLKNRARNHMLRQHINSLILGNTRINILPKTSHKQSKLLRNIRL